MLLFVTLLLGTVALLVLPRLLFCLVLLIVLFCLLVPTVEFCLLTPVVLLLYDGRVVILGLLYVGLYVLCVELYAGLSEALVTSLVLRTALLVAVAERVVAPVLLVEVLLL